MLSGKIPLCPTKIVITFCIYNMLYNINIVVYATINRGGTVA